MKKAYIFLSLFITLYFFLVFLFSTFSQEVRGFQQTVTRYTSCKINGHSWERVGFAQRFMCIQTYSDGGSTCSSSKDCLGDCIVENIEGTNPVCASDSNSFGCRSTIEDFALTRAILCVD